MSVRRFFPAAAALALLSLSVPDLSVTAWADNTADEADLRFSRGVAAYKARRFEEALAEFFLSNRLVRNSNVILNIARCYEQLGQGDEAYRYYAEYLESAPEGAPGVRIATEGIQRLTERVALVRIDSEPQGANIFIGRKDLGSHGVTPRTLALKPGTAKVILSLDGHEDAEKEVELVQGATKETGPMALKFITGKVSVKGAPEGAEVRVNRTDGEAACTLPCDLDLAPGTQLIHVQAPGYFPAQVPVELMADSTSEVAVELQPVPPATGSVRVTSNHEGALVKIDGKEVGFTPLVLTQPVGIHRVEVLMEDMRDFAQEISVDENANVWVQADLRYAGAKTSAASKSETSAEDAPASVTVITRSEIRAFGYSSLPEAIRGIRGFFFSNDRSYENVGVRGFSPPGDYNTRVQILLDGHTMNDVFAAQAYVGRDFDIDLSEVERIEIVRGPVSSLFGSAAFQGLINVVTRRSLGDKHVEVTGSAGSMSTLAGRVAGGHKGDAFEFVASGGAYDSKGEDLISLPAGESSDGQNHLIQHRDGERAYNGSARARIGGLTLKGYINSRKKELPTGAYGTVPEYDASYTRDLRAFVEARYDKSADWGSFMGRLYYDATRYRAHYNYFEDAEARTGSQAVNEKSNADWMGFELFYRSPQVAWQNITAGVEYQYRARVEQEVEVQDGVDLDINARLNIVSAYLSDEIRFGSRVLVNASARFDAYLHSATPATGTTTDVKMDNDYPVNPRLAVLVRSTPGGVTKLMGGSSFRAPSPYELYYEDGGTSAVANAEGLEPERIWTIELEHTQAITDDLKVVAAGHMSWIDNLIYASENADGLTMYGNYRPDDKSYGVRTIGGEVELRWQPTRLTMLSAAYWYSHISLAGDDAAGDAIKANAPSHAFSVKGMFPIAAPYLLASAEGIYNSGRALVDGGSRRYGETFWLNAGLSGEMPSGRFRWFAGVKNLLDAKKGMPGDGSTLTATIPTYGRTFVLTLSGSY